MIYLVHVVAAENGQLCAAVAQVAVSLSLHVQSQEGHLRSVRVQGRQPAPTWTQPCHRECVQLAGASPADTDGGVCRTVPADATVPAAVRVWALAADILVPAKDLHLVE